MLGHCVKTHCVMAAGEILAPGEKKTDETGCKVTECKVVGGEPTTVVESPVCPTLPADCPAQFVVPDQTGCCQVCSRPEKLKNCAAIPGDEHTVGAVQVYQAGHGSCTNTAPVPDMTQCRGQCRSWASWDTVEGRYTNNCTCCQPSSYKEVTISLTCTDGHLATTTVEVPTQCECLACLHTDPLYQVEHIDQGHAALTQQQDQQAEVAPEEIFGAPSGNAQLVDNKVKESVAEVVPEDIFGVPQANLVPETIKEPVAEVSAQDIFGIPQSEVQVAPAREAHANLVEENHGAVSADDIFGIN